MASDPVLITAEVVRQIFEYSAETGIFRWRIKPCSRISIDALAGNKTSSGYWRLRFMGHTVLAHRVAWLYVHGAWPAKDIDHINGDKLDNRIANLRDVSRHINMQNLRKARADNRSTSVLGAYLFKKNGSYVAYISVRGRQRNLGYYKTLAEAQAAYLTAKRELHEGCTI